MYNRKYVNKTELIKIRFLDIKMNYTYVKCIKSTIITYVAVIFAMNTF